MESENQERIPPGALVRFCHEEAQSALRQNAPIPKDVSAFYSFQGRMLSGLLDMMDAEITDEDFVGCAKAIAESVAYNAKIPTAAAQIFLRVDRLQEEDPSQISFPKDFKERVKEAYEIDRESRPHRAGFDAAFDAIIKEPITGLFKELNFIIWEQRLYRRYLRTRFGMKQKPLRRLLFKQTRAAERERNNFQSWWRRHGRTDRAYTMAEIEAAFRRWQRHLIREKGIFQCIQQLLIQASALQTIWEDTIYISFNSLCERHGGTGFGREEFCSDVLQRMKPVLRDFHPLMQAAALKLKQEFSADYEAELADITVWAARNINLNLNKRAAQALKAEGKPLEEAKLERLPANILLALAEEERHGTNGSRNLLRRAAEMLGSELSLDAKHEALRRDRVRKAAQNEDTAGEVAERRAETSTSIVKPEDLAEQQAEDFTLREEARIDLKKIIDRASLTPSEWQVLDLDLQGLTDKEIARSLGKPIGTVKPLLFKARKKLREAVYPS